MAKDYNKELQKFLSANTLVARLVSSTDLRGLPGNKVDVLLDEELTFKAYATVPVLPRIEDVIDGVFYILPDDTLNYVRNGQWVTLTGLQGPDGTTFYPSVSEEGIISWTNDGGKVNPDPVDIRGPKGEDGKDGVDGTNANAKVLQTTSVLTTNLTGTTTLTLSQVPGATSEDISAPETEIYDSYGTLGVVTNFDSDTNEITVQTVTISPQGRQGVRLGAVDTETDLPTTKAEVEALGWLSPMVGDFAYVREDSEYEDKLTEHFIFAINGNTITWEYSHSLNSGDYQLQSSATDAGKILTAGTVDGEFGDAIDPLNLRGDWQENDVDAQEYIKNRTHYIDENGDYVQLDSRYIKIGDNLSLGSDGEINADEAPEITANDVDNIWLSLDPTQSS